MNTEKLHQNAAFDRCVDFLARMIEKYGCDILSEDDRSWAINKIENTEVA